MNTRSSTKKDEPQPGDLNPSYIIREVPLERDTDQLAASVLNTTHKLRRIPVKARVVVYQGQASLEHQMFIDQVFYIWTNRMERCCAYLQNLYRLVHPRGNVSFRLNAIALDNTFDYACELAFPGTWRERLCELLLDYPFFVIPHLLKWIQLILRSFEHQQFRRREDRAENFNTFDRLNPRKPLQPWIQVQENVLIHKASYDKIPSSKPKATDHGVG